jgi:hypothetical protein
LGSLFYTNFIRYFATVIRVASTEVIYFVMGMGMFDV